MTTLVLEISLPDDQFAEAIREAGMTSDQLLEYFRSDFEKQFKEVAPNASLKAYFNREPALA